MAKRKREQNIQTRTSEGRGNGIGKDYIPWIKIQDVASKGRATRIKGIKTNRQHELFKIQKKR